MKFEKIMWKNGGGISLSEQKCINLSERYRAEAIQQMRAQNVE